MMKRLLIAATILCTVVLMIPAMLVQLSSGPADQQAQTTAGPAPEEKAWSYDPEEDIRVKVYRSQTETVEELPLEQYVIGVVSSEMPADFEVEALKAQALTARTYIIKQMLEPSDIQVPGGAMVTDTVMHQVFHNEEELKTLWGEEYEWKRARIEEAVFATQGQVMTFEGEPITASFFSTSNGYTENSEDYWQNEIPYLRSVASPWDQTSPRFTAQKEIPVTEFEQRLGVDLGEDSNLGTIAERTDGGRVAKVVIGDKELSGRQVRDKLELDSSDFQWQLNGDQVVIQTRGWGHGVGMSQYGADGMAKEGRSYEEIVRHFYQGIEIEAVDPYVSKLTAKKE